MADLPPEGFIVRLTGPQGGPVGVGFLIAGNRVVTCAHVVNTALGLPSRTQTRPAGPVTLDFPLLPGHTRRQAVVVSWLPPPREGVAGDDVACLQLSDAAPEQARPARLAANPPQPGTRLRVFGYPQGRREGGWVSTSAQGPVGGGRIQLDSGVDAALRVQPGFSGGPVLDERGRVVGMVSAASQQDRDSYAISASQLRRTWPETFDPHALPRSATAPGAALTVLHVSDTQFGKHHLFGANGNIPGGQAHDILFARLHADLEHLAAAQGLRPDLIIATGDLAERGLLSELRQAADFLGELAEAVGLPRSRVALIPGNHDINRDSCQMYFSQEKSWERDPIKPYFPKWQQFVAAFEEFYRGVDGVTFTPDEPWTLFPYPELGVVVAGLNSTMAESHLDGDHYGWVGERQLRWFASRLEPLRRKGWLRLAAVHHNVVLGAKLDDENLRDADDLDRLLGAPKLVNLVLHGHTHDGRMRRLDSGLIALSTGSAAVAAAARPAETPNQYQLITIDRDGLTRCARQYSLSHKDWVGDTRISPDGSSWIQREKCTHSQVDVAFPPHREAGGGGLDFTEAVAAIPVRRPFGFFLKMVAEATRAAHPNALVVERPEESYLRVSQPVYDGLGTEQRPVGVIDGPATAEEVNLFVDGIHAVFASADPHVRSELVHRGPADEQLAAQALRRGVRLRSFVDYQGLLDLSAQTRRQTERLAEDRLYPASMYVPQRFRLVGRTDQAVRVDLRARIVQWRGIADARLVMVLGDAGRGKTALLRQVARTLPAELPGLQPILVELRGLEKAPTLDELLIAHLLRQGVEDVSQTKLRYMVRSGRLALLLDGFDELELRVGFDSATAYLQTLLTAVTDHAKVVITSRTEHFRSTSQVLTALGHAVAQREFSRVVALEDFLPSQILEFLTKLYGGDSLAAQQRYDLLGTIEDLLGLARNPRMLGFISQLDEQRLHEIQQRHGRISAAELYQEMTDFWLAGQAERQTHTHGLSSFDAEERLAACVALARALWSTTRPTIMPEALSAQVAASLTDLAERGYTLEQATQAVGSGTLLVHADDGGFTFVHQSVMEFLVAKAMAAALREDGHCSDLGSRIMSPLMADFLADLAGGNVVLAWADTTATDPAATSAARDNAALIRGRVKPSPDAAAPAVANFAGADLRRLDLNTCDLRGADLRRAVLKGMRLKGIDFTGADLRQADFTDATLIGGTLRHAKLEGSLWQGAALFGIDFEEHQRVNLSGAADPRIDRLDWQIASTSDYGDVAFSPEGALMAVVRMAQVEIIDVATARSIRLLTGHTSEVKSVAFSPCGTMLATASNDHTARLWNVTTGHTRATLTGHTNFVNSVAFSPDGTMLATASNDHTARLWNVTTGQTRTTLAGHTSEVRAVAFSPDGATLATGSWDGTARLWDTTTGQTRTTLTGHTSEVTAVAFSPDGATLATGSWDGTVRLCDTTTGQARTALTGLTREVTALAFSPDGTTLATASNDRTVRLWDTTTGQTRTMLTGHTSEVKSVAFSLDGTTLATGSWDGTARLWDTTTGQTRTILTRHTSTVTAVAYSPDGATLATGSNDGAARLWDATTGQTRTMLTGHTSDVRAVAFSPDGTTLATASWDGTARLWNTTTGQTRATLTSHVSEMVAVAFSPDGATLATGSDDGAARLWDVTTGQIRTMLTGHTSDVRAVVFSPDGATLATGSWDGTARLWDTTTGQIRTTFTDPTSFVTAVAFSPDGAVLATGSWDGTARLWDTTTGQTRTTLAGHISEVRSVAFSPDGATLATGSRDGTARLWDTTTGQAKALTDHTSFVNAVAFSPDSATLATGSWDGTARLWDTATGELLTILVPLEEGGYVVLVGSRAYKLQGNAGNVLWLAMRLRRFEPDELGEDIPGIRRLALDEALPIRRPGVP